MKIHHLSSFCGLWDKWNNWGIDWLSIFGEWVCNWTSEIFALFIEVLSDVLSGHVNIAIMSKIWIRFKSVDHLNFGSVTLIAFSSNFIIGAWAFFTWLCLVEELIRFTVILNTLKTICRYISTRWALFTSFFTCHLFWLEITCAHDTLCHVIWILEMVWWATGTSLSIIEMELFTFS